MNKVGKFKSWATSKFSRILTWEFSRNIQSTAIVKSSVIWMFLVPLFAKIFEGINPHLNLYLWGTSFKLVLELPFSWQILFFSSLLFSIANFIFYLTCPPAIQKYSNYADYLNEKSGSMKLKAILIHMFNNKNDIRSFNLFIKLFYPIDDANKNALISSLTKLYEESGDMISFLNKPVRFQFSGPPARVLNFKEVREMILTADIADEKLPDLFWAIQMSSRTINRGYKIVCSWMYIIGLILGAIIVLQNVWFVSKHLFNYYFGVI